MNAIFSPVGTSILSRVKEYNKLLIKYSNCRSLEDIPLNDRSFIETHINSCEETLLEATITEAKNYSAELHGILSYYESRPDDHSADLHYLIPSDTYIGKRTAGIVKSYLDRYFQSVCVLEVQGLQTETPVEFQYALADLTVKIIELTEALVSSHKVVFNLTGGFKSIQGFLQVLGTYYADETIYIFEGSSSLLKIPKLPIRFVPEEIILNNLNLLRRLKLGLQVSTEETVKIPESLVLYLDDEPMLSAWGETLFNSIKKNLYEAEIYQPPTQMVEYGNNFSKSMKNVPKHKYYDINERFDSLAKYVEDRKTNISLAPPKSLTLKQINSNKISPSSTHELYAWSDGKAPRIFCHYSQDGTLILDLFGEHL